MNRHAICALITLFMATTACARKDYPQAPPYHQHPKGEFPITASYGFYHPYMTDQQVEWAKEAGFNNLMKALNYEDTDSLVRLAKKHDIPVFVYIHDIRDPKKSQKVIEKYKNDSNIWGYQVFDEPDASKFGLIAEIAGEVVSEAPDKNAFINLLPAVSPKELGTKDYRTYIDDYVNKVNPPFISLDIYPVKLNRQGEIYIEPLLYPTMETVRDVSRESGRPFWSYILSNSHWNYPKPREEFIRFQVFTALAYGAQGLIYYTYLMPDFDREKGEYSDAPIGWDGKRTKTWNMVKNVNSEVRNLEHVFLGADVMEVTQTGERIPECTRRAYKVPSPFRGIESMGEGVTLSHLSNCGKEYLLIVNRDVLRRQKVRLPRTRAVMRLYGDGTERLETVSTITLQPGGFALYSL